MGWGRGKGGGMSWQGGFYHSSTYNNQKEELDKLKAKDANKKQSRTISKEVMKRMGQFGKALSKSSSSTPSTSSLRRILKANPSETSNDSSASSSYHGSSSGAMGSFLKGV